MFSKFGALIIKVLSKGVALARSAGSEAKAAVWVAFNSAKGAKSLLTKAANGAINILGAYELLEVVYGLFRGEHNDEGDATRASRLTAAGLDPNAPISTLDADPAKAARMLGILRDQFRAMGMDVTPVDAAFAVAEAEVSAMFAARANSVFGAVQAAAGRGASGSSSGSNGLKTLTDTARRLADRIGLDPSELPQFVADLNAVSSAPPDDLRLISDLAGWARS